jgi:hypothetical protein
VCNIQIGGGSVCCCCTTQAHANNGSGCSILALQLELMVAWKAYNANIQTQSKQQIVQQQTVFAIYNGLYTKSCDMRCV